MRVTLRKKAQAIRNYSSLPGKTHLCFCFLAYARAAVPSLILNLEEDDRPNLPLAIRRALISVFPTKQARDFAVKPQTASIYRPPWQPSKLLP